MKPQAIESNFALNSICYMCDEIATSKEHVPPKCLFPKAINERDHRKNLITVPSCDAHNAAKSKDDEYLLYILTATITGNDLGLNKFETKVKRAALRKPALAGSIFKEIAPIVIKRTGSAQIGAAISINGARLDLALKKIACAIFYHENKSKFTGSISIIILFTIYINNSKRAIAQKAQKLANHLLINHEKKGFNPDIFCYRYEPDLVTDIMLLDFYASTQVLVLLNKS